MTIALLLVGAVAVVAYLIAAGSHAVPMPAHEYQRAAALEAGMAAKRDRRAAEPRPGARTRRRLKRAQGLSVVAIAAVACSTPTSPCSGGHPRSAPCYWATPTPRPGR